MTSRAGLGRSGWIGAIATVVALAALLSFWAVTAPPLATVDEPRHINSVVRLMQGGGWPPPRTAPMTEGVLLAMREAGHSLGAQPVTPVPAGERSVILPLDAPGPRGTDQLDWMNQHPPTYYAVVAAAMTMIGAQNWAWDSLVMGMRLLSILMVVGGAVFIIAALRRLTASAAAIVLGVLAILAVPQFFNVLGLVTNDALAVLAASGFLYFLVRAWTEPPGAHRRVLWDAFGAGVLLGVGLLTKGTLLTAIPAVFLTLLVVGIRRGGPWYRRLLPAAVAMAIAFVVGGWWYLRNLLVYGQIQSSNSSGSRLPEPADGYSLGRFARVVSEQLVETFWGSIRSTLTLPMWMTVVLTVAVLAAFVIAVVSSRNRGLVLLLLVYPLAVAGLIIFHAWEVYWNSLRLVGIQGRYFFAAIALFACVIALAWTAVERWSPRPVRATTAVLLTAGVLGVAFWGTRYAFRDRWALDPSAAAEAGPFSAAFLIGLLVLASAAAVVAAASVVVSTVRPAADGTGSPTPHRQGWTHEH
jgi:hypothetical protein